MGGLRVLFVASEIFPLAKTGGLADVAGALPSALKGVLMCILCCQPIWKRWNARRTAFATPLNSETCQGLVWCGFCSPVCPILVSLFGSSTVRPFLRGPADSTRISMAANGPTMRCALPSFATLRGALRREKPLADSAPTSSCQ